MRSSLIWGMPLESPAPRIVTVSPGSGPSSGGTALTIDGTNFVNGATVMVNGHPATSVVWVSQDQITCVTPAEAGLPFVPESKALSAYWSARVNDYVGSPWPGVPSAGVSGTTGDLTGGSPPDVGAALNAHIPPNYVAASLESLSNAADITDVVSVSSGTIFGLFNAASALAPSGGIPGADDPSLFTDSNFDVGVAFTSDGIQAFGYPGSYTVTPVLTAAVGDWHMFVATWDGTTLTCYVDSLTPSTVPCGTLTIMTGSLTSGNCHTGGSFIDAEIPELGASFDVWDATDVDNFRNYCNTAYGLSL